MFTPLECSRHGEGTDRCIPNRQMLPADVAARQRSRNKHQVWAD
jgi:hypothetical protein